MFHILDFMGMVDGKLVDLSKQELPSVLNSTAPERMYEGLWEDPENYGSMNEEEAYEYKKLIELPPPTLE